jgi:hypothetical protein
VLIGVIASLVVFLFFEKKAIQSKRRSQKEEGEYSSLTLPENFKRYDTEKNVIFYFVTMFLFTATLGYFNFFTKGLSLIDVFLYIFLTAFIGSIFIFALKIKRSILIKVFAAFLYGAPLIASSAFGFIASYIVYTKL